MSIYYVAYSTTADGYVAVANATYSTARASTAATTTASGSGVVEHSSGYSIAQLFCVYDTSALPAGSGTGSFSFSQFFQGNANADKVRIHEVSSVANKIAGTALAGLTLHSNPNTFPTTDGRYAAAISSVAALPRSSTFSVVVHTLGEENGTTPTGTNKFSPTLADNTGTVDDPFLIVTTGTPWSFVGVSAIGTPVTSTPITLTEPAGVADGDLLIACIASRTTATTAITGTGWTAVGSQNNNNTLTTGSAIASGTMLYRIRSSTPTLSFTLPATVSVAMGQIVAYRGSAQTTPLDASTAVTAAAGTAVSVTGLTTTQDDDLIVAMTAGGQEATWASFTNVTPAATWSTTDKSANITLSGSDKIATTTSATSGGVRSATTHTNGATGKYYAEFVIGATRPTRIGITPTSNALTAGTLNFYVDPAAGGSIYVNGGVVSDVGGVAMVNGDVVCVAWDAGAEQVWFRKNAGNWNNTVGNDPATGVGGLDCSFAAATEHALWMQAAVSGAACTIRNSTAEFTQTVPSGFKQWEITALAAAGAVDTTTAPSSTAWIKRAETVTTSGADTSLGVFDAVRTSTGATGNLTVTASISAGHVVIAGAFKIAAAPAGAITVPVTGVAATGSVGSVTVATVASISVPVTGVQATGAVDQVSAIGRTPVSVPVTGVSGAGAVDQVAVIGKANVSTTGVTATGSVGSVTATAATSISVPVTGVQASGAVGTVTVSTVTRVDVAAPVTGVAATGSVGSVTVAGKASTTVTGVQATGAVGSVTVVAGTGVSVPVIGVQATGSVGTVTVAGTATAAATGVAAAGSVGSVTVTAGTGVTVPVTGVQSTGAVDSVSIVGKANVPVTGVSATGVVGGVSVTAGGSISTVVTGVQATGAVSSVTIVGKATVALTGVAATGSVGAASVSIGAALGLVSVWNGSAWVDKPMMVWTGSAWAQKPVLHWDGSAWV